LLGINTVADRDAEIAGLLTGTLACAVAHHSRDWYAVRFSPGRFAVLDTLADEAAWPRLPGIRPAVLLDCKPPALATPVSRCLQVTLKARRGQEELAARYLAGARQLVDAEPLTLAWYALRLNHCDFALVNFFGDETGQEIHLSGGVGSLLMEQESGLFEGIPDFECGQILSASATPRRTTAAKAIMHPKA